MRIVKRLFRVKGSTNSPVPIPSSVLFNVPVYFSGAGLVQLGENISLGYGLAPKVGDGRILLQARDKDSVIEVGSHVEFSNNIAVIAIDRVVIGDNCLIADFVSIYDSDFHDIDPVKRRSVAHRASSDGLVSPVNIENNVWIGSRAMILKGVTIGENAVIGAGSVVTKSIPANTIACGVPAKVIRSF